MPAIKLSFDLSERKIADGDGAPLSALAAKRRDKTKYELSIRQDGSPIELPFGSTVTFGVKDPSALSGDFLVEAGAAASGYGRWSRWYATLDFSGSELGNKIGSQSSVILNFELEIQFPDGQIISSNRVSLVVENDLIQGSETAFNAPSGRPRIEYLPTITRLTGGTATDLDDVAIASYPALSVLEVITDAEGFTRWRKELWTGAPSPATDLSAGRIVPPDFNNTTMNYVLIQKT